jgi:hypothetical protein
VDVVDPVARQEAEVLVLLVGFGSPPLAERVDQRLFVRERARQHRVEALVQIVVRPRHVERQRAHVARLEEVAADEIDGGAARLALERREPGRQQPQLGENRMIEVFVDEIQQLGRTQLRFDVDGDPVVGRVVDDVDLIMRRLPFAEPRADRTSLQNSVMREWHETVSLRDRGARTPPIMSTLAGRFQYTSHTVTPVTPDYQASPHAALRARLNASRS